MKPLSIAFNNGHIDVMRLLLAHGANPDVIHIKHNACADYILFTAMTHDNMEVVKLLLDYGANPNNGKDTGYFHCKFTCEICISRRQVHCYHCCCGWDTCTWFSKISYVRPLRLAIKMNNAEYVRLLLGHGAISDTSYVLIAYKLNNLSMLKLFAMHINNKTELLVDCTAIDKMTILEHAILHNRVDTVEYIISECEIDLITALGGEGCLVKQTLCNKKEMLALFLEYGVDPNITDECGHTSLYYASIMGNEDIVRMLIDANADISIAPIHLICRYGHTAIVKLLLDYGYDPNILDLLGRLPVHIAKMYNHDDIVALFGSYEPYNYVEENDPIVIEPVYIDEDDDQYRVDTIRAINTTDTAEPFEHIWEEKLYGSKRMTIVDLCVWQGP